MNAPAASRSPRRRGPLPPYHPSVLARIAAALFGGYVLAALSTACLARWLPMAKAQATITAMLLSFAVFALVALLSFGLRSLRRLWIGILLATLLLGGSLALSLLAEGRP